MFPLLCDGIRQLYHEITFCYPTGGGVEEFQHADHRSQHLESYVQEKTRYSRVVSTVHISEADHVFFFLNLSVKDLSGQEML